MSSKPNRLFIVLGGFFVANAIIAEFIGVKIFSLERTFGLSPLDLSLFGQSGLSFNLTAGVLLWPVVFIMTDVINEYFGRRGVRFLSFLAAGLIAYAYLIVLFAIRLVPADFWIGSQQSAGITDLDAAYRSIFGQGLWIIAGSLIAFLVGQLIDVSVFRLLRRSTGEKMIWLRATGSTLVSQFIDSFVVLLVAFYVGAGWSLSLVLAIGVVNYIYKFLVAVILTPVLYLLHGVIRRYLGEEAARQLAEEAHAHPSGSFNAS